MGVMKKLKTAMQLDPTQRFLIYSIEEARAMRNYLKNPPKQTVEHLYDANYMDLPLDYTGDTPVDLKNGETYVIVDLNTGAQKIAYVFTIDGTQFVQQVGELTYSSLERYNQVSYQWLRIRKFNTAKLYKKKAR